MLSTWQEKPSCEKEPVIVKSQLGVDETGMILVVNKKPVIVLPIAARHLFGFRSVGMFSSKGVHVVNHGCSKIARKIIWELHTAANEMVINVPECISLSNSCKVVPTEGTNVVCCRTSFWALLLPHPSHSPWARLPSSISSPSHIGHSEAYISSLLLSPELHNQMQTHVACSPLDG